MRKSAGAIVAAAVFQLPQALFQPGLVAAVIPGGDQLVQPPPQRLILGHRQIGQPDEAGAPEDAALHPQQYLTAVAPVQLRDIQAGVRLIGTELPQGNSSLGAALDGDVPALPA